MCIAGDQPHRSFAASRVDGRPERRRITAWKQLDALFFQCRVELGQIAFYCGRSSEICRSGRPIFGERSKAESVTARTKGNTQRTSQERALISYGSLLAMTSI